jgi:outer membrane lipoprotein SlyB
MNRRQRWISMVVTLAACGSAAAVAQTNVSFGRITAVSMVTLDNPNARVGGTIVGGVIGAAAGSGRSGANRALGGIGGAFAGNQIGRIATQRQAFQYTILMGGTQTITMVTDQAGKRVGDCVAVERGEFNNLRLVADSKCGPTPRATQAQPPTPPPPAPTQPTAGDRSQAESCIRAKEQLLEAETEDTFDRAERRVRLLCGD